MKFCGQCYHFEEIWRKIGDFDSKYCYVHVRIENYTGIAFRENGKKLVKIA
jgi:hypothetical protein